MKSVAATVQAYKDSAGRAQTNFATGVQDSQADQAALAVAQEANLLSNFTQSVTSGRWRQGVTRRGTPYWKQQTVAKASNYGTGITQGGDNYGSAAQKFLPAIAQGVANLSPRGTIDQNLDRARQLALYMHSLKGQLGAT